MSESENPQDKVISTETNRTQEQANQTDGEIYEHSVKWNFNNPEHPANLRRNHYKHTGIDYGTVGD